MAFLEPGGADDDRPLCRDARVEGRLERPRRREIDEDVGRRRELRDIAALVDAAAPLPRLRDRGGERDAHPALAADDADAGHNPFSMPFALSLSEGRPCSVAAVGGLTEHDTDTQKKNENRH